MANKKFDLIKQMNEQIEEDQDVVTDQSQLSEADNTSPTAGDIKAKFGSLRELQRIANYWKEHGQDMDDAEMRERIGMDLEQLEYDPDQQAEAIPKIMDMVRGGEENQEAGSDDYDWVAQKNADERYGPVDDDDESDTTNSDLGYVSGEDPNIEDDPDPIAQKSSDERYGPRD